MYGKILVAIDHSEISDRALCKARDLALLSDGELRVLHLRETRDREQGRDGLVGRAKDYAEYYRSRRRRRQADPRRDGCPRRGQPHSARLRPAGRSATT